MKKKTDIDVIMIIVISLLTCWDIYAYYHYAYILETILIHITIYTVIIQLEKYTSKKTVLIIIFSLILIISFLYFKAIYLEL